MTLSPARFEVLVARELRKAGIEIGRTRGLGTEALGGAAGEAFRMRFAVPLVGAAARRIAVVECRRQPDPLRADAVEALRQAADDETADAAMLFCAGDISDAAVEAAAAAGVALLRVVPGREAFAAHLTGSNTPAWLPDHAAQLGVRAADGRLSWRLLDPAAAELLLAAAVR